MPLTINRLVKNGIEYVRVKIVAFLDQGKCFVGDFLEKVKIVGGSEDEIVDSVETTVSSEIKTELLEAAGCQGTAVWC